MSTKIDTITELEKRRLARERVRERVFGVQDQLLNAQISVALGTSYLYRVDIDDDGNRKRPVQVVDENEIQSYISGLFSHDKQREYYYIHTEKPDVRAIDSLLDRGLGKATSVDESGQDEQQQGVILYPTGDMDELISQKGGGDNLLVEGAEVLDVAQNLEDPTEEFENKRGGV